MNRIQEWAAKAFGLPTDRPAAKALNRPQWWGQLGGSSETDGEITGTAQGLLAAVKSNVWAYNCMRARMSAVAQVPMKLWKGYGADREEVVDHWSLDLLRTVNPLNLNAKSFRRMMESQLTIQGRCIIHKVRGTGKPLELYILPLTYAEVVADEDVFIGGYKWLPTGRVIPREDIIDLYYPSADGTPEADSPTATALSAINRYNVSDLAQTSIDKRGGQKGGLVVHPADEIDHDFRRMSVEWDRKRGDPKNAGRDIHVPFGTNYLGDAFSPVEMDREVRSQRLAKEIMAAYFVPPAAAGDFSDASILANAAVQRRQFWEMFALDELGFIAEELTFSLLWAEDKEAKAAGLYFDHDISGVAALQEDADARANRAISLYDAKVWTLNEARDLTGREKSETPEADRLTMERIEAPPEVVDPAPVVAVVDMFRAGNVTEEAAKVLIAYAAPTMKPEDVAKLMAPLPEEETDPEDAALEIEEAQDEVEAAALQAEIDGLLAEAQAVAGPPPGEAAATEDVAAQALNGSQVESLVGVVQAVKDKTLSAAAAREIIANAFPAIPADSLERMIGAATKATDDGRGKFSEEKVVRVGGKFAPKGSAPSGPVTKETSKPKTKEEKAKEREIKKAKKKAEKIADLSSKSAALTEAWRSLESKPGNEKLQNKIKDKIDAIQDKITELTTGKKRTQEDKLIEAAREAKAKPAEAAKAGEPSPEPQGGASDGVQGPEVAETSGEALLEAPVAAEAPAEEVIPQVIPDIPRDIPQGRDLSILDLDPVGKMAIGADGTEAGIIEKVHRFGTVEGLEATKASPVVIVAGKAYPAGDFKVRL